MFCGFAQGILLFIFMLIAVGVLANEYDSIRSNEMLIGSTLEVLDVRDPNFIFIELN